MREPMDGQPVKPRPWDSGLRAPSQDTLHRLSHALETMQLGVTITDPDGRIVYTNRTDAVMHGYTVSELLGRSVAVFATEGERTPLTREALRTLTSWKRESVNVRKDGSEFPVELLSDVVRDVAGEPIGVVTTCQDITERKRVERALTQLRDREREMLEAQLRQAQKLEEVGRLAGGVAHDFNNVLSVVLSNCEFAASADLADPADRVELASFLRDIRSAAENGANLVQRLLGLTRRDTLAMAPTDLRAVVGEIVAMMRRVVPADIEMVVDTGSEVGAARVDVNAVQQMLTNLITNARDAMPQGGRMDVSVRRAALTEADRGANPWIEPGPFVGIAVRDSGVGMDDATLARVFEPFFTTKPAGKGTGLGLTLAYNFMRQHGGAIQLSSRPGVGTTVELFFPELAAPAVRPEGGLTADRQPLRTGSGTVLLAEDNPALRRAAQRALERLGYRVLVAADGEQALMLYREHESDIDLILSDVVMPKMGGGSLYRAVRAENGAVRFLMVSGYAPDDVSERGGVDPTVPFMQKPWTLAQLARRVEEVLGD